jgi:hypothetical protein
MVDKVFFFWLAVTILMNAYICFRWSSNNLLNSTIKVLYFFISVGGLILAYHHFILHNPI